MPSLCFQLHVTNDETLEDNFQFGQLQLISTGQHKGRRS